MPVCHFVTMIFIFCLEISFISSELFLQLQALVSLQFGSSIALFYIVAEKVSRNPGFGRIPEVPRRNGSKAI